MNRLDKVRIYLILSATDKELARRYRVSANIEEHELIAYLRGNL